MIQHEVPVGWVQSYWNPGGLARLHLVAEPAPCHQVTPADEPTLPALESDFAAILHDYFFGGCDRFAAIAIDASTLTPFTQSVYQLCRMIPRGQTRTYQQLATDLGNPRASRAVGAAMARNPFLLVVPCHRVVGANGRLCGFSAPGGLSTKRQLLDLEQGQRFAV